MPLCRALGDGLWEVRSKLPKGRVIFCFHEGSLIALHGFIKQTQKTPKGELDLAIARMKELGQ
jgi:phage-related protein